MSDEMSTLTGAYAVDALTGQERAEFEHHLAACAECAQEMRELRETAARLGTATAAEPPEGLKQRVLHEIAHTRQASPVARARPGGRRTARRRTGWGTRVAVAASVVGIGLAAAFGGVAWQTQQELDQARQRIEQTGQRSVEMERVLHAADARIVHGAEGGAEATAVVSADRDKAVFMSGRMPAAPTDRVHQLWAIDAQGPTSMGLLGTGQEPIVTDLPDGTTKLAVTTEPAGGSEQPTTTPFMQLSLRA
ncbi:MULTISPECIES: anti-sigma factor [unclassified Actinopolyspora]|uniref:anti-sigma factor n=1 Tax=unclassified Actinopolyspora TaxID=2639451 RepID=UPI0013F5F8EE|nr:MULTISPECIES: anti-sigma factor [unclassified Actinopolyspora]NHD16179.1 anti-sigma factor [Actinopolyspora sp. BKK2]NHE74607.1 anti-sigma factor [Actinopolyspora sp. BKK1]